MKRKTKMTILNVLKEALAWSLSLIVIVPFLIVLVNALKDEQQALTMSLSLPTQWHWENFVTVWNVGHIPQSFFNSVLISVGAVFLSIICASLCAFVLARNPSKCNKKIFMYFSLGLMFPVSMVTVVKVMRILGLYNTRWGVILLFGALILPLSVFLYYNFIMGIPQEIDEAAIVDGAGTGTLFFRILFPVLKPVTVTVVMLNFLSCWNDFTVPLYILPDPDKAVIVQQVYHFYGTFTASWNLVSVTILYAIAPILAVYILGQRYIISGMVAGAVKG
ncbi:MAG: carbohydrate ABC transporter permease [Clostridia bacterium]